MVTKDEPTPEQAAAALRVVDDGRERVIRSAIGPRSLSIVGGLVVFLYGVADDLFPAARPWLGLPVVAVVLVLAIALRTRAGSSLLGQPVMVSRQRFLRAAPVLGIGIAVALIVTLFHVPHGEIYYGALVGCYIMFLGPRFQLWVLRRQDKDHSRG